MNSDLPPSIEITGTKTLATKEDVQRAMVLLGTRHKQLDIPNLLRLTLEVPLPWEAHNVFMAQIPRIYVEVAKQILARFSLDTTGGLKCRDSLDAQGFLPWPVPRLRERHGFSMRTISRCIRNLRNAGIIDTKQGGPRGLWVRLNPHSLMDWADKLAERKRRLKKPKFDRHA